jgi:RNA polymerase-associated protein LEO1
MSSSEDEAVRRPGRQGRALGGDLSNEEEDANMSGQDIEQDNDDNDDKDLFGSGSEADLEECVFILYPQRKKSYQLTE